MTMDVDMYTIPTVLVDLLWKKKNKIKVVVT